MTSEVLIAGFAYSAAAIVLMIAAAKLVNWLDRLSDEDDGWL